MTAPRIVADRGTQRHRNWKRSPDKPHTTLISSAPPRCDSQRQSVCFLPISCWRDKCPDSAALYGAAGCHFVQSAARHLPASRSSPRLRLTRHRQRRFFAGRAHHASRFVGMFTRTSKQFIKQVAKPLWSASGTPHLPTSLAAETSSCLYSIATRWQRKRLKQHRHYSLVSRTIWWLHRTQSVSTEDFR